MLLTARFPESRFHPFDPRHQMLAAALSFLLSTAFLGVAQCAAKNSVKPATKKEPEIKEELTSRTATD